MIETLLANHKKFLSFLERRVGDRATAEEILQSAFVKSLEKGDGVAEENAVAWFYRLLRNALIDHYRHRAAGERALKSLPPPDDALDVELRDTICECVTQLLPTLKPEYATMLKRVDLDEQPIGTVAKAEGITANNATVRLHRARQALKKRVEEACGTCLTHGCADCSCGMIVGQTP